jgi:hypothetical protein
MNSEMNVLVSNQQTRNAGRDLPSHLRGFIFSYKFGEDDSKEAGTRSEARTANSGS